MPEIVIQNANIVLPDGLIPGGSVALGGQRIEAVSEDANLSARYPDAETLDAGGAYLMPGFIDTHSDHIEQVIQPRPQSLIDFELALLEQEKQLVNQGITTMFHSLSVADVRGKSAIRNPENLKKLAGLIRRFHEGGHLIRHRLHCRYDMLNVTGYEMLLDFIRNRDIHLLSFTDHTPGQGQYRDVEFFKKEILEQYYTEAEREQLLADRMKQVRLSGAQLEHAADLAHETGIPIASHDDDTVEKLDYVTSRLHATISEFPVELSVAREARRRGMRVVVGASNILMGRSHSNNLSACEAVREDCADILVSDYFPPSILHAVFKLHREGLPLWRAAGMASLQPALAVGLGDELGSIEPGKRGDLFTVQVRNGLPVVTNVFIDGAWVSRLAYRSTRP
jgi:alpha-D-ribose 1-methylphosphonate 5-triphosphate diphosphatase